MSNFRTTTPQAERVRQALQNVNEPTSCPSCGSIFLAPIVFAMFTGGSYGLRQISNGPKSLYFCGCGELVVPSNIHTGNAAGSEGDLFSKSVMAMQEIRKRKSLHNIAEQVVSISEFNELVEHVNSLAEKICGPAETGGPENIEEGPSSEEEAIEELEAKATAIPAAVVNAAVQAEAEPKTTTPPALRTGKQTSEINPGGISSVKPAPRKQYGKGGANQRIARQGQTPETQEVN